MEPPCSQSTWNLHLSPQIHKKSKAAPFRVAAVLCHVHTWAVVAVTGSGSLGAEQGLANVNNHPVVKLTWEREIKALWCPSSPCSCGKCAAHLPKPCTDLLMRRIWLKYLPRKKTMFKTPLYPLKLLILVNNRAEVNRTAHNRALCRLCDIKIGNQVMYL